MDENLNPPAKKTPAKRASRRAGAPQGPPPVTAKAAPAKVTPAKVTPAKVTPADVAAAAGAAGPAKATRPAKAAPATKGIAAKKTTPAKVAAKAAPAKVAAKVPARKAVTKAVTKKVTPAQPVAEPIAEPVASGAASEADVERAWNDNRLAQVLYHDWEAETYDEKWSISFDERCISYARDRFSAVVGPEILQTEQWPYPKALEIGAGTGFFSLNLRQAGVLDEVHVSDVSAGMVESARRNAHGLGFEVEGAVAGAESLPYDDDTFDVVVGHAVIHHIPDVEAALREVLRVLRPGGRFVIAGEPTRVGDWYARRLGQVTWKLTTAVTQLAPLREKWARSQEELDASSRAAALESVVDLHTFVPEELQAMAERAGAAQVRVQTEELLAAFVGWPVRTFEAAVNPKALGWGWSMFAYRSWQRLSALDRVLSRALPDSIFYNVGVTGTKPRA